MTPSELTLGVHHVGLTVPDVAAATHFFVDALGYARVGDVPDYPASFVSDGHTMITLWQAEDPAGATPFDRRRNLGLHHLAIRVAADRLDDLAKRLGTREDLDIEFEPEALGNGGARHMMCRIPGNLRVEFIAA